MTACGRARHWRILPRTVGIRSPVCIYCGSPNPKPLKDWEWREVIAWQRDNQRWQHVNDAIRARYQPSWVGRVWNHVDTIAARNGHELDWVTEGLKSHPTGQWITARCKNCSPPRSGNYLSLPLDDHRTEAPDWWHEGVIPAYLKRKCRQTHEPRPGPSGRKKGGKP